MDASQTDLLMRLHDLGSAVSRTLSALETGRHAWILWICIYSV